MKEKLNGALSEAPKKRLPLVRLGGPKNYGVPSRGNFSKKPINYADTVLIDEGAKLLEAIQGRQAGWTHWKEAAAKREQSTLQKFVETIVLPYIDPSRKDFPKSRAYGHVKERLGLVKPRR